MCFCRIQTSPFCVFPSVVCSIPYMCIISLFAKVTIFNFNLSTTYLCVNCINSASIIFKGVLSICFLN